MINSNYYVVDGLFKCPTTVRNARAAQMTHNILKYNRLVERELIPPMLVRVRDADHLIILSLQFRALRDLLTMAVACCAGHGTSVHDATRSNVCHHSYPRS